MDRYLYPYLYLYLSRPKNRYMYVSVRVSSEWVGGCVYLTKLNALFNTFFVTETRHILPLAVPPSFPPCLALALLFFFQTHLFNCFPPPAAVIAAASAAAAAPAPTAAPCSVKEERNRINQSPPSINFSSSFFFSILSAPFARNGKKWKRKGGREEGHMDLLRFSHIIVVLY